MVVDAKRGDFVSWLDFLVRQLEQAFYAFLRMSFHVIGPGGNFCVRFLQARTSSGTLRQSFRLVYIQAACTPSLLDPEGMSVPLDPLVSSIFSPWASDCFSFTSSTQSDNNCPC